MRQAGYSDTKEGVVVPFTTYVHLYTGYPSCADTSGFQSQPVPTGGTLLLQLRMALC